MIHTKEFLIVFQLPCFEYKNHSLLSSLKQKMTAEGTKGKNNKSTFFVESPENT